jgi:predicted phage terminase large subunit-like protein
MIAAALDRVLRGECRRLIINIAPRYGKTEQAVINFMAAGLALNPAAKFIHLSYSDNLALDNSEQVRDMVQEQWFTDIFPEVGIKKDSKGKKKWYTTNGGGVYATSTRGQITGFGAGLVDEEIPEWDLERKFETREEQANLDEFVPIWEKGKPFGGAIIIDDAIKPEDAHSELLRNKVNERWNTTIASRVNSRDTPVIIIMQRTHPDDLCGYLINNEGTIENGGDWEVLSIPCINEDGTALWPHKHSIEELMKMWVRNPAVFESQYLQNPKPLEGLLYKTLRSYKVLPPGKWPIRAVADTADEGKDFLCLIIYLAAKEGYYIIDVLYTQDGVETTEGQAATMVTKHGVKFAKIESNNGGKGWARAVERICRDIGNKTTTFKWYHQSKNKQVRIYNAAAEVQNMIFFPEGWERLWPAFNKSVTGYLAKGGNLHDDAEDALTMIVEAETAPVGGSRASED